MEGSIPCCPIMVSFGGEGPDDIGEKFMLRSDELSIRGIASCVVTSSKDYGGILVNLVGSLNSKTCTRLARRVFFYV